MPLRKRGMKTAHGLQFHKLQLFFKLRLLFWFQLAEHLPGGCGVRQCCPDLVLQPG